MSSKASRRQARDNSNPHGSAKTHRLEQFSGPVPHPDLLAKYDALMPGLAERLVQMAETSLEAEISLKAKALDVREQEVKSRDRQERQEHTDYRMGVLAAMFVVILFLCVAVFSIYLGAYAIAGAVIAALAGIIWSVRRQAK